MKRFSLCLLAVFLVLSLTLVHAAPANSNTVSTIPTPAPITAAHFDVDAATAAYIAQLSPAARARSDAYFEHRAMIWKAENMNTQDIHAEDASAPPGAR